MSKENELSETLKEALKAGDKTKISTVRLVLSEIKNRKIAEKADELEDEKIVAIIQKMAHQRKESIDQFKKGDRQDLVKKESEELAILEEYLPEQISEEDLEKIVSESIVQTGATSMKDMGAVMKDVMSRVQGQADGKVISEIVKRKLG
ncbi:MAG: GatB/YqeY domain-containing protein [Candidatus Omnitrophota bacterium]